MQASIHAVQRLEEGLSAHYHTMLTNTLRDLETLGIVNSEQFNEIPPHAEYSLTEKGRGLLPVFFEISKWGEHNLDASSPAETDNTGAKFPQR